MSFKSGKAIKKSIHPEQDINISTANQGIQLVQLTGYKPVSQC